MILRVHKSIVFIKENGLWKFLVGGVEYIYYVFLSKLFSMHPWHTVPSTFIDYSKDLVALANLNMAGGIVVDIGCGLGGILDQIDSEKKLVLIFPRRLSKQQNVMYLSLKK